MRGKDAFRAERTLRRSVRGNVEAPEGVDRDLETRRATRSIDQDRGPHDGPARRAHRIDRLLDRSARRHDVVDNEHALACREREPAAELATGRSLAPLRIDRTHAELPRDFMGQDDPARGWAGHCLHPERPRPHRDRRTEPLRFRGMLEHLELLEIERRVAARSEDEVSLLERTRLAEHSLDIARSDGHRDYSARVKIHDVSVDLRPSCSRDFSTINASAARLCVAHGIKLVGIDYLSIEPQGLEKEGYPVHKTLLGANVVIVEGLDLRSVAPSAYEMVCAPIKLL